MNDNVNNLPAEIDQRSIVEKQILDLVLEATSSNLPTRIDVEHVDVFTQSDRDAEELELSALMVLEVRNRLLQYSKRRYSREELNRVGQKLLERFEDDEVKFDVTRYFVLRPFDRFQGAVDRFMKRIEEFVAVAEEHEAGDTDFFTPNARVNSAGVSKEAVRLSKMLRTRAKQLRRQKNHRLVGRDATLELAKEFGPFVAQTILRMVDPEEANKALKALNSALAAIGVEQLPNSITDTTKEALKDRAGKAASKTHPDKTMQDPENVRQQKTEAFRKINELVDQLTKAREALEEG